MPALLTFITNSCRNFISMKSLVSFPFLLWSRQVPISVEVFQKPICISSRPMRNWVVPNIVFNLQLVAHTFTGSVKLSTRRFHAPSGFLLTQSMKLETTASQHTPTWVGASNSGRTLTHLWAAYLRMSTTSSWLYVSSELNVPNSTNPGRWSASRWCANGALGVPHRVYRSLEFVHRNDIPGCIQHDTTVGVKWLVLDNHFAGDKKGINWTSLSFDSHNKQILTILFKE